VIICPRLSQFNPTMALASLQAKLVFDLVPNEEIKVESASAALSSQAMEEDDDDAAVAGMFFRVIAAETI